VTRARILLAAPVLLLALLPASASAAPASGVSSFGLGAYGQLGDGGVASSPVPLGVAGLPGVVTAIAAGCFHSLALTSTGQVWAWGLGQDGQLGDGATMGHTTPARVSGLPAGVVQVAAGCHHSLALTATGQVWAWGESGQGELGDGTNTVSARLRPVHVTALDGRHVVRVAAGGQHSAAITVDGAVYGWGDNRSGELGSGDTISRALPAKLTGLPATSDVALGPAHSLFLATDGTLLAAGLNNHGQLGDGSTTNRAKPVTVAHDVRQASSGDGYSVAVTTARTVLSWGRAGSGQLGVPAPTADRTTPAAVPGTDGVVAVAAGGRHVLAVTASGRLLTWGDGGDGQLGSGATPASSTPTAMAGLAHVAAVAAGDAHSLVLTSAAAAAVVAAAQGGPPVGLPNSSGSPAASVAAPAIGVLLLAAAITRRTRWRRQQGRAR
jgi:alpha-tubulin suppressor-like RCC1 family protein